MQEELAGIKGNTLDWVKDRLRHLRVVTASLENNKLVYSYDGMCIKLPTTSGIYAFYSRADWMYTETPLYICLLYTSPSPRDVEESRMPSSA